VSGQGSRAFGPRLVFAYDVNGKGHDCRPRRGQSDSHFMGLATFSEFGLRTMVRPASPPYPPALQSHANIQGVQGLQALARARHYLGAGQSALAPRRSHPNKSAGMPRPGRDLRQQGHQPQPGNSFFSTALAKCGDGVLGAPSPCDIIGHGPQSPLSLRCELQHRRYAHLRFQTFRSKSVCRNRGYRLLNFADINQAPSAQRTCMIP